MGHRPCAVAGSRRGLQRPAEAAEAYNGQQGDIWDAHADMLLATIGALLLWPMARKIAR